jgi:hypothetical protein
MAEHIACMVYKRRAYSILIGYHKGKRLPESSRRRWEYNVVIYLKYE